MQKTLEDILDEASYINEHIVERSDGWHVVSKDRKKNLGGPYKNRKEAVHRLQQIEYFKHGG